VPVAVDDHQAGDRLAAAALDVDVDVVQREPIERPAPGVGAEGV
jgi:hypothetical protein